MIFPSIYSSSISPAKDPQSPLPLNGLVPFPVYGPSYKTFLNAMRKNQSQRDLSGVNIHQIEIGTLEFPNLLSGKDARIVTSIAQKALASHGDLATAEKAAEILSGRYRRHIVAQMQQYRLSILENVSFAETPTSERILRESLQGSFRDLPFRRTFFPE